MEEKRPERSSTTKQMLPEGREPLRKKLRLTGRDLRATTIGWEIAIPLFAGPLIGFLLDRRFDTGVRWTLILLVVGVIAAVAAIVRYVNYEMYMINKEQERKKKDAAERR